jgi:uncharacterized protein (TIGR02646 family)
MIGITRPPAPTSLLDQGTAATRQLCADYSGGVRTFDFKSTIYAARTVRDALRVAQHRKCAFCESVFDHTGYGDVEHFRPKAGYKQREADELRHPGYYWLAYAWDNLLYSCQLCNQRFKQNLFPLKDGRHRAYSHTHNLSKEEPLLVDPSARDPSRYIGFREEYAFAVGGCREGECTIAVLGLNREALVEVRRGRLQRLRDLTQLRDLLREKVASAPMPDMSRQLDAVEETLQASIEATGEYAAMARAFRAQPAPAWPGDDLRPG